MVIIPIFLRTFAPSAKEMTACWCSSSWETEAVSIALFWLLLLATRLGSCSVVRRWQCFFDSVLFGQDVGESARGAARWTAPFFASGEFSISSNTLFPMTAVRSYRCRLHQIGCILHQFWCIWRCKEILFHPILGGYNYLTCSLFRVLRASYEVIFSVGIGKMPVSADFFTFLQIPSKCDIQQIEGYSISFC